MYTVSLELRTPFLLISDVWLSKSGGRKLWDAIDVLWPWWWWLSQFKCLLLPALTDLQALHRYSFLTHNHTLHKFYLSMFTFKTCLFIGELLSSSSYRASFIAR